MLGEPMPSPKEESEEMCLLIMVEELVVLTEDK